MPQLWNHDVTNPPRRTLGPPAVHPAFWAGKPFATFFFFFLQRGGSTAVSSMFEIKLPISIFTNSYQSDKQNLDRLFICVVVRLVVATLDWNVTNTEMSPKLKCHQNWNVAKNELPPKLKCHLKWNVTKTEMSPKLKCHQNLNVTKTEMSPKLKCHQNWNVKKTEMSPRLKYQQNLNINKTKITP